ncbi:MAG: winged helix-turn-helix domain-containing protein [Phycisphaerae bacterium]|nr:crosslink repair DNA glycosylase YcaQ family protein [Tepidisphaeraceae bacterium]
MGTPLVISAAVARRLLLSGQGLARPLTGAAVDTPGELLAMIESMGFVQIDTINTVDRAHHLILAARSPGYRRKTLAHLLETSRQLFEHWTHDASIIPTRWFAHWRPRFERYRAAQWHRQQMGEDADRVVRRVLSRVRNEGPLMSKDFEGTGERHPRAWWGWKPNKVALDYLWRIGKLHVVARREFHKVYDLTERAVPACHAAKRPREAEHVEWACRSALERLGTATVREISQFWRAISVQKAKGWVERAARAGAVMPVVVESADGSRPVAAYALADLPERITALADTPTGMRLLAPFDPILRDRARAKRLFNFDFRFEGFVPAAQRKHGYYVMAALEGDQLVGRADPKFDRTAGVLRVRDVRWEAGVRATRQRLAAFGSAAEDLARWIGAVDVEVDH